MLHTIILAIFIEFNMIDYAGWMRLSSSGRLNDRFIIANRKYLDIWTVLHSQVVSTWVISKIFKNLTEDQLEYIAAVYPMTERLAMIFIDNYPNEMVWRRVSERPDISEQFIDEFKDYLDWENVSMSGAMFNDFRLEKYAAYIKWAVVIDNYTMGRHLLNFISKNNIWNSLEWAHALRYQKFPEEALWLNRKHINWTLVCIYQQLSPEFMTRCSKYLNWAMVSKYQRLTWAFYQNNYKQIVYCQNVHDNINRWFKIASLEMKLGNSIWGHFDQFVQDDPQSPIIEMIDATDVTKIAANLGIAPSA